MHSAPIEGSMRRIAGRRIGRMLAFGVAILLAKLIAPAEAAATGRAVVLEIDGVIGPAVADYVARELRGIEPSDSRMPPIERFTV